MAQIYLRDELIQAHSDLIEFTENNRRQSISEIISILNKVTPANIRAEKYTTVDKGVIVSYNYDKDINFIFTSRNLDNLKSKQLMPVLSILTQLNREVFVCDTPHDIASKTDEHIKSEI